MSGAAQKFTGHSSESLSPDLKVPLLQVSHVSKRFPGVAALTDVSIELGGGEIHALLGENGAGKSTLIKIITGLQRPDEGALLVEGKQVEVSSLRVARQLGISLVPQDVLAVPHLSVGRNILLGFEGAFADKSKLNRGETELVEQALDQVGAKFSPLAPASSLSIPDLRLAQIARTLIREGRIIILDEPTAVLSEPDAEHLLERLLSFRKLGKGIIYISHRLSEVMRIADRATVLRDGRYITTFARSEFDRANIVAAMARVETSPNPKRSLAEDRERRSEENQGEILLKVESLSAAGRYEDVSFSAREGEVVGIAGVQGSGHGHLVRALSGLDAWGGGNVEIGKRRSLSGSVASAFRLGLAFIPADRRKSAIVPQSDLRENLALGRNVRKLCRRFGLRWPSREKTMARERIGELGIQPGHLGSRASTLSGGNQQKLALARVIEGNSRVLLLEEPTQGVDIRAKAEIHELIKRVAIKQMRAVVVASSEFEELLDIADIIYVMRLGKLVATFGRGEASYRDILHSALP
jgi:ABC-type sugar transport system ATPase subunit